MEKPYNNLSVGQYVINRRRKPVVMLWLHNQLPVGQHYTNYQSYVKTINNLSVGQNVINRRRKPVVMA